MSGWTTATITLDNDNASEVLGYLINEHDDDMRIGRFISNGKDIIRFRVAGYSTEGVAKQYAFEVMEAGDKLVIIKANDTTDSGLAILYKYEDEHLIKIDIWGGYEGAQGRDAASYMKDNYDVDAYAGAI